MVTLEQVEELRSKAAVGFGEAKEALEQSGGDMLEALIYLERMGKAAPPKESGTQPVPEIETVKAKRHSEGWENFKEFWRSAWRFFVRLLTISCENHLEVSRNDSVVISMPVLAFILLLVCIFWVIVPLMIVSLFFSFKYRFRGRELGTDSINGALDKTAAVFEGAVSEDNA